MLILLSIIFIKRLKKILKGYCIKEGISFPFIHDLERLYSLLSKKTQKYVGVDEQIIILNNYSNQLRYPESDNLSIEDAKDAKNLFSDISAHLADCCKEQMTI
ncbi:MAG: HEPN domain-containing protein [Candidatus Margulisiibacteriota bacterium]